MSEKHFSKNHHTVLFKKILASFFATESMKHLGMNPANMLASFVSPKQFFGLVHKRMAEHFKLNLFDISLDPFDIKIGFGDDPTLTEKHMDIYYAYNSSAYFVGYKSYTPNTIATGLTMRLAAQIVDIFHDHKDAEFKYFLYTVYCFSFVIVAKMKVFPDSDIKTQFNWFINTFWSFFEVVCEKVEYTITKEEIQTLKTTVSDDVRVMFTLFYYYKNLSNSISAYEESYGTSHMDWLLIGDMHHKIHERITKHYMELYEELRLTTHFSHLEKQVIDLFLPADILIKYLFGTNESKLIAKTLLQTIYPPSEHQELFDSLTQSDERSRELIDKAIDFTIIKKKFFVGLQNYVMTKIKDLSEKQQLSNENDTDDSDEDERLDEFLSYLGELEQGDTENLPQDIQVQSFALDRLVNFYISYLGGFATARGDSGYMRLYKPNLLKKLNVKLRADTITKSDPNPLYTEQLLVYHDKFFKQYEQNAFYYQYIFNHIRSGKESFIVPTKATIISHRHNAFVMQLFSEGQWAILLQDLNPCETKLYIRKTEILDQFQEHCRTQMNTLLHVDRRELLSQLYSYIPSIFAPGFSLDELIDTISDREVSHLKDRLYCLDFWVVQKAIEAIRPIINYNTEPSILVLGCFATLKETLFGFLLYLTYIVSCEQAHQKNYSSDLLIRLYCESVLPNMPELIATIENIWQEYREMLDLWILLDDNQDYMYIGFNNWTIWLEQHGATRQSLTLLTDEDCLWLRGYYKHITYYNKRFLIPTA